MDKPNKNHKKGWLTFLALAPFLPTAWLSFMSISRGGAVDWWTVSLVLVFVAAICYMIFELDKKMSRLVMLAISEALFVVMLFLIIVPPAIISSANRGMGAGIILVAFGFPMVVTAPVGTILSIICLIRYSKGGHAGKEVAKSQKIIYIMNVLALLVNAAVCLMLLFLLFS